MKKALIFVDSGYLMVGCQDALPEKQSRQKIIFNEIAFRDFLPQFVEKHFKNTELLRTYWYDGVSVNQRLSVSQSTLSRMDGICLRLGTINAKGQQKGVDGHILCDMMELAINRAADEFILISGDADLLPGVTRVQAYGVRVTLIAVGDSEGNQSHQLVCAADRNITWTEEDVSGWMKPVSETPQEDTPVTTETDTEIKTEEVEQDTTPQMDPHDGAVLAAQIQEHVDSLSLEQVNQIQRYWQVGNKGIPPDMDAPVLSRCGRSLNRKLETFERRFMREQFVEKVKARVQETQEPS